MYNNSGDTPLMTPDGYASLSTDCTSCVGKGNNMRTLAIILLGLMAVAAFDHDNHQRIVGGSVTTINQYPEIAALLRSATNTGHRQSCGGTIINNRSILTAAHCTINDAPARWRVRVGSTNANSGGVIINSAQIFNHPQYQPSTTNNDVSIIRLATAVPFSNVIRQGSFAGSNFNTPDNVQLWVAGWGTTSENGFLSEQLRHVQVWAINLNTCRQRYAISGRTVTDNMLCSGWLDVGGRDACQGDSGGPVYQNGVVVGVTSWGVGCARANFPGVNARVSSFANWIQQNQ